MINQPFHCGCCQPPRQIYYQAALIGPDGTFHEQDHTPAVPGMTAAERKAAEKVKG